MPPFRRTGENGITLVEVVITAVILGVLFAISIPSYVRIEEKTKAMEAANTLRLIQAEEKRHFLRRDEFVYDIKSLPITDPNQNPKRHFDYHIQKYKVDEPNFEARARRRASARPPYNSHEYLIHKDGVVTGPLL
ncbi:MAG: prepilin-type N-terminal cleavage/methylation domain-containing protein [Candidatus Omnitrophota bacterium]